MKRYTFRVWYIPERMMGGIRRYIEERVKPGYFLTSVICNNLSNAVAGADDENLINLPAYAAYFYNEAPQDCWGSKKIMEEWLRREMKENKNRYPREISGSIEEWGVNLPPFPSISLNSNGDLLPPGRYAICYTQVNSDGLMSGNGPIGITEFEGESKGITLLNFSSSYRCWITDTDGKDFYLADVQSDNIISPYYNAPLQSMFVIPSPRMSIQDYIAYNERCKERETKEGAN